jgi:hypothetical protein
MTTSASRDYCFLNSASKAARPGLTGFSPGVAGGEVAIRRPVASRTVAGRKKVHSLLPVLEKTRAGIASLHSKRAPGSKWTQLRQQCEGA